MPRRARVTLPNVAHHIIQRGNNRQACFYCQQDYQNYLSWLKEYAKEYYCYIHAFVLMTNHIHILVTPEYPNSLALMMKQLGQRYVQYINRTYKRSGTLWEGRFKSCLVQSEEYVLSCYRYIELNPVRANLVSTLNEYNWSSFHHNGLGERNDLITEHPFYIALGNNNSERITSYRHLFDSTLTIKTIEQIRNTTNGNYVLGNNKFKQEVAKVLGRRVRPGKPGRPRNDNR
ncbi:transposase [Thalassotalea sp. 1_MG-2023]|uniref:transposase n=1 Tax=Thalassotalea sp. 1_MG-2023 TaxID=3062680 RepID=UPI0026E191CC|nr:transposase [Thalassotalea sp. 1_MG-2023]MDO6427239.1 transposase [Thalassotalea sp. 1_MG-2023]